MNHNVENILVYKKEEKKWKPQTMTVTGGNHIEIRQWTDRKRTKGKADEQKHSRVAR